MSTEVAAERELTPEEKALELIDKARQRGPTVRRLRMDKRNSRPCTDGKLELALQAIAAGSEVPEACEFAEVGVRSFTRRIRTDPAAKAAYEEALDVSVAYLEQELHRRAIDGWQEPVFHRGKVAGFITRYDNTLLLAMLKARAGDKYGDKRTVVFGTAALTADELTQARIVGQNEGLRGALELVAAEFARQGWARDAEPDQPKREKLSEHLAAKRKELGAGDA